MGRTLPTWPVAAGSLVLGFAVAQATGVRPLGGAILVLGAAWCALRWQALAGTARAIALLALYLAAFVVSHLLADAIGAWAAVALVAATVGAAAYAVADRKEPARATFGRTCAFS